MNSANRPAAAIPKGRVFISYARADSIFAERLRATLNQHGFEAYLDKHDILPGEPWQERLGKLIGSADTVVFIMSPNSVRSTMCDWEVNEAERTGKRLLPVVHVQPAGHEIPGRLKRLNYIFLRDEDEWRSETGPLTSALLTDIEWIREHTRLGELAGRWAARSSTSVRQAEALLLRGTELVEAEDWLSSRPREAPEPTNQQRALIAASQAAEQASARRARNRNRIITTISMCATGAMAVLGWHFLSAWQDAVKANSRFLGDIAQQQITSGDPQTGVLVALEALSDGDTTDLQARFRFLFRPSWGGHEREAELALARGLKLIAGKPAPTEEFKVYRASLGPDSTSILAVGQDAVRIIDARSGSVRTTLAVETHDSDDFAIFSPDGGDVLVTSRLFGTARIWNVQTGRPRTTLVGHRGGIRFATYSPTNSSVLTASEGGAVLWDAKTGKQLAELEGVSAYRRSMVFSRDGTRIIEEPHGNAAVARIWNAADGKVAVTLSGHTDVIRTARFNSTGNQVVTSSEDGSARVWDAATGKEIARFARENHTDQTLNHAYSAEFSPDGMKIIACFLSGAIHVWDINSKRLINTIDHIDGGCTSVSVSSDGARILSQSTGSFVHLWKTESAELVAILPMEMKGAVYGAEFSRDDKLILTRAEDLVARVWDGSTGRPMLAVGKSPYDDGGNLVIGDKQQSIRRAKQLSTRCLTWPQRRHFNLTREVPRWCLDLRKWPYDGIERPDDSRLDYN